MISRLRTDVDGRLFEVFLELAHPECDTESAYVLQKYPENYSDEEVMKPIPKFTFPYSSYKCSSRAEHFTFVLTDLESKFRFGFCRLTPDNHTCLCFISCLPWYEIFYGLLDRLSDILNSTQHHSILPLLQRLHAVNTLGPGETVSVATIDTNLKHSFVCPVQNQLPSIPENRNLTELFNLLDVNSLMILFASLINERRVLIVSERLSRLTACVHAAALLLYPMSWQHLYIPVLPSHLLDYCSAPMPYLIGVHSSIMKRLKVQELGDAVVLDVDNNAVTTQHNDLAEIPVEVVGMLKRLLKQSYTAGSSAHVIGDSVSRAFLKTLVALIGGYRDALKFRAGEQITFDAEAFVQSRPTTVQPFLRKLLQMQVFQQFVADRLDMLNSGEGFSDEFELEVHGRKFQRGGKDKLSELANKMRDKSKKTIGDMKSKREDAHRNDIASESKFYAGSASERMDQSRPPRPPPPNLGVRANGESSGRDLGNEWSTNIRKVTYEKTQHYHLISPSDDQSRDGATDTRRVSIDDSALLEVFQRPFIDTDIMSDPDIQSVFHKSYSVERLSTGTLDAHAGTPYSTVPAGTNDDERLAPLCDFEDDEVDGESDEDVVRAGNAVGQSDRGLVTLGRSWVRFTSDSSEPADDSLSLEPSLALDTLSVASLGCRSSDAPSHISAFNSSNAAAAASNVVVSTATSRTSGNSSSAVTASKPASHSNAFISSTVASKPNSASARNTICGTNPPTVDFFVGGTDHHPPVLNKPTPTPRETILRRTLSHQASMSRSEQAKVRDKPLIDLDSFQDDDLELDPLKSEIGERETNESTAPPSGKRIPPAVQPRLSRVPAAQGSGNTASMVLGDLNRNLTTRGSSNTRARAAFIEAEAPKPVVIHQSRLGSLDQFDPLATGQLAVDSYDSSSSRNSPSSSLRSNVEEEENLLKEWNLDVRYRGIPGRDIPVGNPVGKPASAAILAAQLQAPANMQPFSSMPNLSGGVYTLPPGVGLAIPHGNITMVPIPYQNVSFVGARPMVALSTPAKGIPLPGNFSFGNSSAGNSKNSPVGFLRNSPVGTSRNVDMKSSTLPVNSSLSMDPFTENHIPSCASPVNHSVMTFDSNGGNSGGFPPNGNSGVFLLGNSTNTSSSDLEAKRWEKFD